MLKCLDDSNENVRFAGCEALTSFLQAAPASHFGGGVYSNIVEQLLVHMDDPDSRMQEKVFKLLLSSVYIDKEVLTKKVYDAKASHRSSNYCSLLLEKIEVK